MTGIHRKQGGTPETRFDGACAMIGRTTQGRNGASVQECDEEGHDHEGEHEHIGPENRAHHGANLSSVHRTPHGTSVLRYFAAQVRDFRYRMFAIAEIFDEFGRFVYIREGDMATQSDRSDSEGIPPDVAARLAMIEARLETPMTDEQRSEVRGRIARSMALGAALRAYSLTNADEPEIALVPYQGEAR